MANIMRALLLLLTAFTLPDFISKANAQSGDWAGLNRYRESNALVRQLPSADRRVVFFGNSITELWYKTHPAFFDSAHYIPRGISGQTSYQFMVRLRPDVIELKPEYAVIGAPTNDVAENTYPYSEDATLGNYELMVDMLKASGIKVILTSALPTARYPWRSLSGVAAKIVSLNGRLRALAKEKHCLYVDYYPALVGEGGAFRSEYTYDGVHPNAAGYSVMEKIIGDFLNKKLK